MFSLLYFQSIYPFKTECHEQGMFPAINTWMGGSFPALLSGFHSSCDQDGLEGLLLCFFILFPCSVILVDLNINIDLMFIFVIFCTEWVFLPIKWAAHENAEGDVPSVIGFLISNKKGKEEFAWGWLSAHASQKDRLATRTIRERGSDGWIEGASRAPEAPAAAAAQQGRVQSRACRWLK